MACTVHPYAAWRRLRPSGRALIVGTYFGMAYLATLLGLLAACSAIACIGLLWLGNAGASVGMLFDSSQPREQGLGAFSRHLLAHRAHGPEAS